MTEQSKSAPEGTSPPETPIPIGQIIFDDVFLLLMLGLVVPTLFYIVWGLWHTSVIPLYQP